MATIVQIRRDNLRRIADELGGLGAFAAKVDRSESQVSQFMGRNPTRKVGDKLARNLERQLHLKEGALDAAPAQLMVRDAPGDPVISDRARAFALKFDRLPAAAQDYLLGLLNLLSLLTKKSYLEFEQNMEEMNHARADAGRRARRRTTKA